jgi:hypothetical protein
VPGDANWSDVVLRLTCDGANNSTTFTDLSLAGLTVTANGGAKVSTTQSKWGGASLYLDNTDGTYLSVAATSNFQFGTSPWTVEYWCRPDRISNQFGDNAGPVSFWSASNWTSMFWDGSGGSEVYDTGAGGEAYTHANFLTTATWHHVEWSYDGTTMRVFFDGALSLQVAMTVNVAQVRALKIGENYSPDPEDIWPIFPFGGYIDDIRITRGLARHTAPFTPPTEAYPTAGDGPATVTGYVSAASLLGEPAVLGCTARIIYASAEGPLGQPAAFARHDFTSAVTGLLTQYVMDLVTPSGLIRVPISSWQATLQTEGQSYLQCVVPACAAWVDSINAATEFVIYRRVVLPDGTTLEAAMASAPVSSSLAQGGYSYSATLTGYSDSFAIDTTPAYARTLEGLRTAFSYSGLRRIRCSIDWLLRPGQTAIADGDEFTTRYISYYVNDGDTYMDVAE